MTCETPSMCRPRDATSVATRTASWPSLNSCSIFSRRSCGTLPGERARRVSVGREPAHEVGRGRAAVDEDEHAAAALLLEEAEQQAELLGRGHVVEHLGDAVGEHALGLDLDLLGVVHVLVGELHDADRERGREEHRLAAVVRRAAPEDPAQVADESHVEHAVGLVDDEDLDVAEGDGALLLVVEQAARRSDEEVGDAS